MTDEELLAYIRGSQQMTEDLAWLGFEPLRAGDLPEPVTFAGDPPFDVIAGSDTGGYYLLIGEPAPQRPVVYVGSEGEGGLLTIGLADTLALLAGVASLHDTLNGSWDPDGGASVRAWVATCLAEIAEDEVERGVTPARAERQARVRDALNLPPADGLLESLHRNMADERYRPISEWGPLDSMLPQ
jgi:hypothetical protein